MRYRQYTYRVSAKALIKTPQGLLLVKEDSQYWDLPGGGMEHFEDPVQALHREIEEELGVKPSKINKIELQTWATYDKEHDRPLLFLVYPTEIEELPKTSVHKDVTMGYFDRDALQSLAIEPHLEQYRDDMILALG
jgi:8-oxo-dGTP pyrophosphatase MutT (NUDIX family)